jgi:glyoxylase-like metal-dependent hydrolase (beta-lactamase superfamily II)
VWSIPVPIPHGVLRYVLVYALELDSGIALIDSGWDSPEAWAALNNGLQNAGGSLSDVRAVVITHIHRDHSGLAGRIRENTGAWIGVHPADAALLSERYSSSQQFGDSMREQLDIAGVPRDSLSASLPVDVTCFATMTPPDILIEDGSRLNLPNWDLDAIWTPGHSPGHICLFSADRELLFTGDHVLPRISPNISFHSPRHPNPLGDYLDSLRKVQKVQCDEVLPGHEWRFTKLDSRVGQLLDHHSIRLAEIGSVLSEESELTCWEVALHLTWSRDLDASSPFVQRTASGETLAHLALLESQGSVTRNSERPAKFRLAETGTMFR